MFKKVVGIVLVLSMLLSAISIFASDISYSEKNGTVTITSWNETASYVIDIPEKVSGKPVTAIASGAFNDCKSVCEIIIPKTVKEISADAFVDCVSLKNITVSTDNPYFTSENGLLYSKDKKKLIKFCDNSAVQAILPKSVTDIGNYAFYGMQSLEKVVSGGNILDIGAYAFYECGSLYSINLSSVVSSGEYAFYGCRALTYVDISSLENIPKAMFYTCNSLVDVVLSSKLAQIGECAFAGCFSLDSVLLPTSARVLSEAFLGSDAVLYCSSYALDYAKNNGFKYVQTVYNGSNPVTSLSLKDFSVMMKVGQTYTVSAIIQPINAQVKEIYCVSQNEDIATVGNGVICAKASGVTNILVKSVDGKKSELLTVIVTEKDAPLQSEHPYKNAVTSEYSYTVEGAPAKIAVTFSSDTYVEDGEDFIIISDKNGEKVGTYTAGTLANKTLIINGDTVNVSLVADRNVSYYGFCIVSAVDATNLTVANEINAKDEAVNITYGGEYSFKYTVTPSDAIVDIKYYSSDKSVISVDENGTVSALNSGSAYVVAFDEITGKTAQCFITVKKDSYEGIHYTVSEDGVTLTYYDGDAENLVIPETIDGKPVKYIASGAFMYSPTLKSVTIPAGVLSVADGAFAGCMRLTSFIVNDGNTAYSAYGGVLYNKDKTELVCYPGGISGSVTVCNTAKAIRAKAFYMCYGITSVTLPESVETIGIDAFEFCESLNTVFYSGSSFSAIGGCLYSNDGKTLLIVPCAKSGNFSVAEGTVEIEKNAFSVASKITSISLPSTLQNTNGALSKLPMLDKITVSTSSTYFTTVNGVLFSKDKKAIVSVPCTRSGIYCIPSYVTTVGDYAFSNCERITGLIFPLKLQKIGDYAFYGADGISSLILPAAVTSIGVYAFDNCSNLKVYAPSSITQIGKSNKAQILCVGTTAQNASAAGYDVREIVYSHNNLGMAVSYEKIPSNSNLIIRKQSEARRAQISTVFPNNRIDFYYISFNGYVTQTENVALIYCGNGVEAVYEIIGNEAVKVDFMAFDGGICLTTKGGVYAFVYDEAPKDESEFVIGSLPSKTEYMYGEQLDSTGMKLYYKNFAGLSSEIVNGYECDASLNECGLNTVTIRYEGYEVQFNVTVYAETLSGQASITGEGKVGATLILNLDGVSQSTPYEIIWYRDETPIDSAKGAISYTVTPKDGGASISVQIKAVQGFLGEIVTNSIKIEITALFSDKYKINSDKIISGITEKTTWASVLQTLNIQNNVKAYKGDTVLNDEDFVTTATEIRLYSGDTVIDTVTVVVTGDINGDGKISLIDFANMKAYMLKDKDFTSFDKYAADVNGDGKLSLIDFAQFKAHMLGDIKIEGKEY